MSSIDTKFLLRSITILLLFQAVFLQSYSQSGTIDFSTTDNTNLGAVANDGEGGSTDIGGVQYDIILINDAGTGTGGDVIYDNSGAGFEGISFSSTPGSGAGFDGISLSTNDGSEFDFNGFSAAEYGFVATTLTVQGFKDGSSTGSTTVSLGAFAVTTYASSDFSDAIFGDVDEVRILGDFGGGNWFGALDAFVLANPITSNTAPTASSFTATNGPFEDLTYTFSTADFGYMDGDGDPLNNLLIEAIPAAGTLYVDADGGDDFDAGEQLSNGSTVSLANLNAGNLQYIQNGSTNTSFQFEVNDGTENSSGNFVATLNVTPIPTVTLAVSPTSRFESITTPANVTTTLSNTYGANVTVNLSFSGTATGGGVDYTLGSSSIIVNAGATSNSTTITNVNDALFEGNETVIVDITGVTNGTESGAQQVTYTISDDETPPNVVFELLSIYDPTSENGGVAFITAELDAASGVTTTVPVSFSGTATQGVDYSVSSSNIVIAAGDTKDSVSITGINDAMVEGDESIIIDMGAPT
ncbi:MAG: Calx-beta domain-containing protein [Bacteroidota bacterium]